MKIFLSIASYRDPFLPYTVMSAYQNATYKSDLMFGIVEHAYAKEFFDSHAFVFKKQIRHCQIDPIYANGVCAARHLAQTLYNNETYFFQIDSHTVFEPGWDEYLIAEFEKLNVNHPRPVITGFPREFVIPDYKNVHSIERRNHNHFLALRLHEQQAFKDDYVILCTSLMLHKQGPVYGFYVHGNSLFTVGEVISEVPYDPHLYFYGEEQSLALRLWTHGYDIFHLQYLPMYVCYDRNYRMLHWADPIDQQRGQQWWWLEQRSRNRLREIVTGQLRGIYGVGQVRSIQAYADFCGIDYLNRKIDAKAITGEGIFLPARL